MSGDSIKIQLLDNPFIDEFVPHLKRNLGLFHIDSWIDYIPASFRTWDSSIVKECENSIKNSIRILNDLNLNFPIKPEEVIFEEGSSYSRDILNRLHRHFTTSHRSVSWNENITTWKDGTDLTFNLNPKDMSAFVENVHNINDMVHVCEGFYTNERESNFPIYKELQVHLNSSKPLDPLNNIQENYFKNIKDEHYQYFTDNLVYDVWLPLYQIQGKNYWIAYFNEDDPREWDVTTNIFFSGSFSIGDRSLTKNEELLQWLQSYDITPGPLTCGMPLGNVIEGKELIFNTSKNKIIKIEIYE